MRRVLVTDDDPVARQILGDILTHQGYSVDTADTAAGCLAALVAKRYDALCLDVLLGADLGTDVLRTIRANARFTSLAVVMLSASSKHEVEQMAEDERPDVFLEKPFTAQTLIPAIEQAIKKRST